MANSLRDDLKTFGEIQSERRPGLQRGLKVRGRDDLENEILGEMASALKRAEVKLLKAFDTLEETKAAVYETSEALRAYRVGCYDEAYEALKRARWDMIVHREAIGLRDSRLIRKMYPIPSKIVFKV